MRVLYVASEFKKSNSDIFARMVRHLPKALKNEGVDVSIVVPHLPGSDDGETALAERLIHLSVDVDGVANDICVLEGRTENRVKVFYLESEKFKADVLFDGSDASALRTGLFSCAVCKLATQILHGVDVIQCDGAELGLVPVFAKNICGLKDTKVIVMVGGIEDKLSVSLDWVTRFGLDNSLATSEGLEFYGKMSILKGAYLFADDLILPSAHDVNAVFAPKKDGHGMEGVLLKRKSIVKCIGAGLDLDEWNPEKLGYSAKNLAPKAACRQALAAKLGLDKSPKRPIISYIGALKENCGIDLISDILDDLMDNHAQLIFLGKGDDDYVSAVKGWSEEFRGAIVLAENVTAREVLAGSDIVLLPQRDEGWNTLHLKAMRFGAIPVARLQGCAAQDIVPCTLDKKGFAPDANGFAFENYDPDEFFNSAMDALDIYANIASWNRLREQAMNYSRSWKNVAKDYMDLYAK